MQATRFSETTTPIIYEIGMQIATGVFDPVTALLVLRRRFGYVALEFEECNRCRPTIEMSMDFDQLMIDAKQTRDEYLTGNRWKALGMFLKFQWHIFRACLKWVLGL